LGVGPEFKPQYRKKKKNIAQYKKGLVEAQVLECLLSKHEAQCSNPGNAPLHKKQQPEAQVT
jgi:hypothetical protein